jgi:hypothetical protein
MFLMCFPFPVLLSSYPLNTLLFNLTLHTSKYETTEILKLLVWMKLSMLSITCGEGKARALTLCHFF